MIVWGTLVATAFVASIGILANGCKPASSPPVDAADSGYVAGEAGECPAFCRNLERLGCSEAQPSRHGIACVDLCQRIEKSATLDLPVHCVAMAADVSVVRACGAGQAVGRVRCANVMTVDGGEWE